MSRTKNSKETGKLPRSTNFLTDGIQNRNTSTGEVIEQTRIKNIANIKDTIPRVKFFIKNILHIRYVINDEFLVNF